MSRGPQNFRESDVKKALLGAKKAGRNVAHVEIEPATGNIILICDGKVVAEPEEKTPGTKSKAPEIRSSLHSRGKASALLPPTRL